MLVSVVFLALFGSFALAVTKPAINRVNLKIHRQSPSELNHFKHNPEDAALFALNLYVGSGEGQLPMLKLDLTKGDLELFMCNDTSLSIEEAAANMCYNPSLSTTYVQVSNFTGADTFKSAFPDDDPYILPNVTFIATRTKPGHDLLPGNEAGIMGLGWPALQRYPDTFFPYAYLQHYREKIFSLTLDLKGCAGYHIWGGYCSGVEHGERPHYVPLTSTSYWQFALQGFQFGTINQRLSAQAVITTTKGYIGMPLKYLKSMMNEYGIRYDGLYSAYVVDCNAQLPDFVIMVEGKSLRIRSGQYVYREAPLASGQCVVNFEDSGAYGFGPDWYFGLPLMQAQCVTFDYDRKRVGFTENNAPSHCEF